MKFLAILAITSLCLSSISCSSSRVYSKGPTTHSVTSKASTQVIRDLATSTMEDIPESTTTQKLILQETKKIDVSIDSMVKERDVLVRDLTKEREENTKLFNKLLAWIMIGSSIGLAVSIAAALYFRTKVAIFGAIASAMLLLVAATLTVILKYIVWISIFGGLGVIALVIYMIRHDNKWTKENTQENTNG